MCHGAKTGENPNYQIAFFDTDISIFISYLVEGVREKSWTNFPYSCYSGLSLVNILIPQYESGPLMGPEPVSGGFYFSLMSLLIFYLRYRRVVVLEAEGLQLRSGILQNNNRCGTLN